MRCIHKSCCGHKFDTRVKKTRRMRIPCMCGRRLIYVNVEPIDFNWICTINQSITHTHDEFKSGVLNTFVYLFYCCCLFALCAARAKLSIRSCFFGMKTKTCWIWCGWTFFGVHRKGRASKKIEKHRLNDWRYWRPYQSIVKLFLHGFFHKITSFRAHNVIIVAPWNMWNWHAMHEFMTHKDIKLQLKRHIGHDWIEFSFFFAQKEYVLIGTYGCNVSINWYCLHLNSARKTNGVSTMPNQKRKKVIKKNISKTMTIVVFRLKMHFNYRSGMLMSL